MMEESKERSGSQNEWSFPWRLFWAEFLGTALLLLFGLSSVIFMFGEGTPVAAIAPSVELRRVINGFLFGSIGASIALSPIGKESGAHINPVVTLGFCLAGTLDWQVAGAYVIAQLAGAVVGCLPLLAWGSMGWSIAFGATVPGKDYSTLAALMGEVVTTFGLVAGLCVFLAFRNLRRFTPAMIPFLYAFMVPLEASISGTSTNPARSFGPAVISGEWRGWWVYWVGPVIGCFVALACCSRLAKRIEVPKLYYFDTDRSGVIRKWTQRSQQA
jgi:aquaporin Z